MRVRTVALLVSLAIVLSLTGAPVTLAQGPAAAPLASNPQMSIIGQVGGASYAIAVKARTAHGATQTLAFLGVGPRVVALDVTNPAVPLVLGQSPVLPGFVYSIVLSGDYAYVATGFGLQILDVSDPANPRAVSDCAPGGTFDVALQTTGGHSYAYLAAGGALEIINVDDPLAPSLVATTYLSEGYAEGIALAGNYAALAATTGGLRVFDISNLSNVHEVSHCATAGTSSNAFGVAAQPRNDGGTDIYLANYGSSATALCAVTLGADGTLGTPQNYATASAAWGVSASATSVYVSCDANHLSIYDRSDLTARYDATVDTGGTSAGSLEHIALLPSGSQLYAYTAIRWDGLSIVDVTAPASGCPTLGYFAPMSQAQSVAVSGGYAYVAQNLGGPGHGELWVVDARTPASARTVAHTQGIAGLPRDVAMDGRYVYVASSGYGSTGGLSVVDVADPLHPVLRGNLTKKADGTSMRSTWAIAIAPPYAYLINIDGQTTTLCVADLADPDAPAAKGLATLPYGGINIDIAAAGSLAVVADGSQGLRAIDVSDAANPTARGSKPYDSAWGVAAAAGRAYVASQSGFFVLDTTDPDNLMEAGSLPLSYLYRAKVSGPWVYAANSTSLLMVNVVDPHAPRQMGSLTNLGGNIADLAVVGDKVYVAAGDNGLYVIQVGLRQTYMPAALRN